MSITAIVLLLAAAALVGFLVGWLWGWDQGYAIGLWDACNEATKQGEEQCL